MTHLENCIGDGEGMQLVAHDSLLYWESYQCGKTSEGSVQEVTPRALLALMPLSNFLPCCIVLFPHFSPLLFNSKGRSGRIVFLFQMKGKRREREM